MFKKICYIIFLIEAWRKVLLGRDRLYFLWDIYKLLHGSERDNQLLVHMKLYMGQYNYSPYKLRCPNIQH